MKRIVIAVAAALLATGAAHASPTLPREFQGAWCGVEQEGKIWSRRADCMASSMLNIASSEVHFHGEPSCTPAHVKPARNGRYHVTLACPDANAGVPMQIVHLWMRVYSGSLYMQSVDSTFTKPTDQRSVQ